MPEISEHMDKKFFAALDFWVPERNEIGHYQINLTQEEIEKRCVEYEEKLTFILLKIAFLAKYRLVSVREIKVQKPKYKNARFHHVVDLLNSSDSDFAAKEIDEEVFSESHSVFRVGGELLLQQFSQQLDFLPHKLFRKLDQIGMINHIIGGQGDNRRRSPCVGMQPNFTHPPA